MHNRWDRAAVAAGGLLALLPALAAPTIYSCIDANGRRLTSDRPIPACLHREQRLLNADGSLREVVPPTPTAEERTQMEARARQREVEAAARRDAVRRDRNLVARYPNEEPHRAAREAALDDVRAAMKSSRERLAVLEAERRRLQAETEFYVGRELPAKLRQQIEANEATAAAQRTLMQNQEAELVRINALYDTELERLKKLWAGAPPGSLGAGPEPGQALPVSTRATR